MSRNHWRLQGTYVYLRGMAGEFLFTLGNRIEIEAQVQGRELMGRVEPRIGFVGRSNVGKSSLLNAVLGQKLARVSSEPGKTRSIHGYYWNEARKILVDMPGYGYARQAQEERNRWAQFLECYLERDENLEKILILIDSRIGPTDKDEEAIRFFSEEGFPLEFIATKVDQLKTQKDRAESKSLIRKKLQALGFGEELIHEVSSKTGKGMTELKNLLKGKNA